MQGIYNTINSLQVTLNMHSFGPLIVLLIVAFIIGKVMSAMLYAVSRFVSRRADASGSQSTVTTLRRIETWIILSIAIVQVLLALGAVYIWWNTTHDEGGKSSTLIGVSAIAVILLGGITGPLLRDIAFGASMMAEHWYGVGDLISIDFPKVQGVVESVSLRSTRIRGMNGETHWVANSSIQGVSVTRRGLVWIAVDIFVNDIAKADILIEQTNQLLPTGSTLVAEKLAIKNIEQKADNIWRVTAVAGVAPGREWTVQDTAIAVMKKLDETNKKPVLLVDPVSHFDDHEAETQISRALKNARKPYQKFNYAKLTPNQLANKAKKQNKK